MPRQHHDFGVERAHNGGLHRFRVFGCTCLKTQDKPRPVDPSPQVPAAFTSQLDDPPFASNVRSLFLPARPLIAEGLDSGAARPLTGDVLAEIRAKSFESDE